MNRQTLFALSLVVLAGAAFAAPAGAPNQDGLAIVASKTLDEVYLRPGADLAAYRKVMVDPARVVMRKNWLKDLNATRAVSRWLVPSDVERITDEAATTMTSTVADVFKLRGYEIVEAPGPGVLRLSPHVDDLDVYAPDVPSATPTRLFTKLEAGQATLVLDMRDATTGALVGRVVDRRTAQEVGRANRATDVSNLMWFQVMFQQWAVNSAAVL
jgi:hypothetical protein